MFFSKKPKYPSPVFHTYLDEVALYESLIEYLETRDPSVRVWMICFFEQTWSRVKQLLEAKGLSFHTEKEPVSGLLLAYNHQVDHLDPGQTDEVLCVESHPLYSCNEKVYQKFSGTQLKEIRCFMSLDQAVMEVFGADRIRDMMIKLGLKGKESICHGMVDTSILRAMKKLESSVTHHEDVRTSQMNWLQENVSSK